LKDNCLYLHFDGVRYCFKKDPNITLLVEHEAEAVGRVEEAVRGEIYEMLKRGAPAIMSKYGPRTPARCLISNRTSLSLTCRLSLPRDRGRTDKQRPRTFESYGDKPRQFRNGLALAVTTSEQIEALRRNQLFTARNAMANLADLAGNVTITVKAEKADGLDKAKLQNALWSLYARRT
jgi:hypothetical protein